MKPQIRLVAVLLFSAVSMSGSFGQASGSASDGLLAADAAWMKVYAAKDLEKSVAFFDNEGSMLPSNAPIATGKDALTKLIGSAFATPDYTLSWHANRVGVARSGEIPRSRTSSHATS